MALGKNQNDSFERLKQLVTEAPVLRYYDQKKELVLTVDASSKGLGATVHAYYKMGNRLHTHKQSTELCSDRERDTGNHLWLHEVSPIYFWTQSICGERS